MTHFTEHDDTHDNTPIWLWLADILGGAGLILLVIAFFIVAGLLTDKADNRVLDRHAIITATGLTTN